MTTDEPDEQLVPASPEDETRIRALLSDARETAPMPAAVVARLDDALAGLAAERQVDEAQLTEATGYGASVHPITRSRRHRVAALLGAAAAVAVLGLGVGAVLERDPEGANDAGSAESQVDRGDDDAAADAPSAAATSDDALSGNGPNESPEMGRELVGDRAYPVHSRHLTRDLARIQTAVLADTAVADYQKGLIHAPKSFACQSASWGRGILVGVRYDGDPAYVAFREPMGDSQVVEVLQCGTGDVLRSTTLPVPS